MRPLLRRTAMAALLPAAMAVQAAAPAPPAPFTATYAVLRDGAAMGQATVRLAPAGAGQWTYSKRIDGTAGLAAMLGARLRETSRLRWREGAPETLVYDYQFDAAIKHRERHLTVANGTVQVRDGKQRLHYRAVPGMVERNTESLAIGLALRAGHREITLPVAVRQTVQQQRFAVRGSDAVQVPAGHFRAERIERTDADRGFTAWYVPDRFPVPVQVTQRDGGNLTMKLVRYREP